MGKTILNLNNLINKFYLQFGRSKQKLEITSSLIEVWLELIKRPETSDYWEKLSDIISDKAKYEWGKDTYVCFDIRGCVKVVNPLRRKSKIFCI